MPTVEYQQERKGFWREPSGTPTSEPIALEAWTKAAHELLGEVAATYQAYLDLEDFAERVQLRSQVRTTRPPERWVEKVLVPVDRLCDGAGEPRLSSLVVLDPRVDNIGAARERLECYRWAGSEPADGGVPMTVVPMKAPRAPRAPRARAEKRVPGSPRSSSSPRSTAAQKAPAAPKKVAPTDRPVAICPRCFMALPATGVCDNCD